MAELFHEHRGDLSVGDVVDRADHLLRVPCHAHLASRVAGFEQASELGVAAFVETFVRLGQESACPVERVVLAAPVTERLVLDPPPALVQLGVGELHEMKRVGDLGGVGDHRVEHGPVRARQVKGRPPDPAAPGITPFGELNRPGSDGGSGYWIPAV